MVHHCFVKNSSSNTFVIVTAQGSRSSYSHALNAAMAPQKSFRLVHLYCILTNENLGFKAMVGVAGSKIIIAAPQCQASELLQLVLDLEH